MTLLGEDFAFDESTNTYTVYNAEGTHVEALHTDHPIYDCSDCLDQTYKYSPAPNL